MGGRARGERKQDARALGTALLLHALALAFAARHHDKPPSAGTAPRAASSASAREVAGAFEELDVELLGVPSQESLTRSAPIAERPSEKLQANAHRLRLTPDGSTSSSSNSLAMREPGVPRARDDTGVGLSEREANDSADANDSVSQGETTPSARAETAPGGTQDEPPGQAEPGAKIDLGIGPEGWRTWLKAEQGPASGPSAKTNSGRRAWLHAPTPSKTGGLQEGLEARDRELGLSPAGRVLTALYRATHADSSLQAGRARFSVTLLKSGAVEVSLSGTPAEGPRWASVAQRAADELRRAPPRLPKGRDGVRLVLEIVAEQTMPNGAKVKELHGPRLTGSLPKFRSTEAQQKELQAQNPTAALDPNLSGRAAITLDMPGVFVEGRGKVCSYKFGVTPLGLSLGGGCDLANIGAKPQRMVHTRVVEESAF